MESRKALRRIKIFLLLSVVVLSASLSGLYLLIPLGVLCILSLLHIKDVGKVISRGRFWVLVLSPVLICAFLIGPRDISLIAVRVSQRGFFIGVHMAARAFCLILVISLLTSQISLARIIWFFESKGLRGLGLSIGVAYNMLSTLAKASRVVFETLRLRGVLVRHPVRSIELFCVSVVYNALQHGDDIVNAAAVRAYGHRRQ